MAESIRYTQTVQVTDGPSLSKTALLSSEAYDVISATIEKSTGPTTINIQPGEAGFNSIARSIKAKPSSILSAKPINNPVATSI